MGSDDCIGYRTAVASLERTYDVCTHDGAVFLGWVEGYSFLKDNGQPQNPNGFYIDISDHRWTRGLCYFMGTLMYGRSLGGEYFGYFACAAQTVPNATPGKFYAIYAIGVPFWFLAAISAMPPTRWACRTLRKYRRRAHGLCMTCGYDLRSTKDCCPECGTSIRRVTVDVVSRETSRHQHFGTGTRASQ